VTPRPRPDVLFPGSFAPLHAGHLALAAAAGRHLGRVVHYEISTRNVDKPDLPPDEVARRVAQFDGVGPVWLTAAPTFAEKADLFPGVAFVLGYDTAVRLVDPKYYGGSPEARDAALRHLLTRGCRMVIGGRIDAAGVFRVWNAAECAAEFAPLLTALTEEDFRADVSSTALRAAGRAWGSHPRQDTNTPGEG